MELLILILLGYVILEIAILVLAGLAFIFYAPFIALGHLIEGYFKKSI